MSINADQLTYNQAINILTSQGKFHICLGLERIKKIMELLGNPQDKLKIIHVAGTNGKGSVCAMLSAVLNKAGYKTGLYTSPHLLDYTERIKVLGKDILKCSFSTIFKKVHELSLENDIHLTEFEILTAMAFCYFEEQNTDIVLLETGLGGRLDATNIVMKPLFSVITSIDLDHVDRLGDTIEKIAQEKAGIIKNNCPVITLKDNKGLELLKEKAKDCNSTFYETNKDFELIDIKKNIFANNKEHYNLSLLGLWQGQNLSLVLMAVELLNNIGIKVSESDLKEGLKQTSWPARMQYIKDKELVIDGAHNIASAMLLRKSIDLYFPDKKRVWLYGSLSTKDYKGIIETLFREEDTVICTQIDSMASMSAISLKQIILESTSLKHVFCESELNKSINLLYKYFDSDTILVIAGSLYLAGNAIKYIITE